MANRQVTKDELNSILRNGIEGGQSIQILYLMPTDVYKTKKAWRKDDVTKVLNKYPDEFDKEWYKLLSYYNENGKGHKQNPLYKSVVMANYTLPFSTIAEYKESCAKYTKGLMELRESLSITQERTHANNNPSEEKDGYLVNATGNHIHKLNMAKASATYTNYLLDDEGNVIESFPEDVTTAMKGIKSNIEKYVIQQLSEEDLEVYKQKRKELDAMFRSQEFLYDAIVGVVVKTDSGSITYYNENIKPRMFDVNKETFLHIGRKVLSESI